MRIDRQDLTVIVPTLNEADNIGRFLASVPPDVAMEVVDSSDDDTADITAEARPSTRVIRAKANIPVARQIGGHASATRWLLFTDADVVFAPTESGPIRARGRTRTTFLLVVSTVLRPTSAVGH